MSAIGSFGRDVVSRSVSPTTTGLVMGAAAASLSFRPSLLERDVPTQTAVAAGSFGIGYGVGIGTNLLLQRISRIGIEGAASPSRITTFRVGAVLAGAGLGLMSVPINREHNFPFANTLETAGRVAFVAGAGSLAAQLHGTVVNRIAHTPRTRFIANAALVGAELIAVTAFLDHRRQGFAKTDSTTPSRKTLLTSTAIVSSGFLALKASDEALQFIASKSPKLKPWQLRLGAAALAGVAIYGAYKGLSKIKGNNESAELKNPLPTVYGPNKDQYDTKGLSSLTNFLQATVSKDEIQKVMGGEAKNPIRIAVGFANGDSPEGRGEIAFNKIVESGALERDNLLITVPPGAGFVDERIPASAEFMSKGNIATIAIGYSNKASFLSLDKVDDGKRTYDKLLTMLDREKVRREAKGEHFPKVLMWGNSLGAWSSQEVGLYNGLEGLSPVDRALWVGTPGPSGFRRQVVYNGKNQYSEDNKHAMEYSDITELDQLSPGQKENIKMWFHTRATDPVGKVDVDMLWRRPLWLATKENREKTNMPQHAAYVPGVTFLQELGDIVTTMRIAENPSRADEGHTYVVDGTEDVANAFFPNEFDKGELAKVEAASMAHEDYLKKSGLKVTYGK